MGEGFLSDDGMMMSGVGGLGWVGAGWTFVAVAGWLVLRDAGME